MTLTLSHDVSARRLRALTPLPLIALSLTSCGLPKDPDGATARIGATHILRVGISNNPPWAVVDDGQISGIEPDLVRDFAGTLGARVQWVANGETPLMQALERRQLDLVVGGVTTKSPWTKRLGTSLSYAKTGLVPGGQPGLRQGRQRHVLLSAPGESQLLLRLDRFLAAARPRVEQALAREMPHG